MGTGWYYALWDGHGESFVVPRATTWQSPDVRDTAQAAQEAATSSARLLSSPSSTSSSSTTPSPGISVQLTPMMLLTRLLLLPGLGCPWRR